ncbi:MAG: prepilin-type N-terminal cleavage/methylation domain-containing protein [Patescibacteria group bacterium]|jgi:general secretion pathway protein G
MKARAFTLIELLVVVAIIGILATVVTVTLNSSRGRARDSQRMTNVRQVGSALGLYRIENDHFPATAEGIDGMAQTNGDATERARWTSMGTSLRPWLSSFPVDPSDKAMRYCPGIARCGNAGYTYYELSSSLESDVGNGEQFTNSTDLFNTGNLCYLNPTNKKRCFVNAS